MDPGFEPGSSRENVNRALAQFVNLGVLTIDRGHVTIVDGTDCERCAENHRRFVTRVTVAGA